MVNPSQVTLSSSDQSPYKDAKIYGPITDASFARASSGVRVASIARFLRNSISISDSLSRSAIRMAAKFSMADEMADILKNRYANNEEFLIAQDKLKSTISSSRDSISKQINAMCWSLLKFRKFRTKPNQLNGEPTESIRTIRDELYNETTNLTKTIMECATDLHKIKKDFNKHCGNFADDVFATLGAELASLQDKLNVCLLQSLNTFSKNLSKIAPPTEGVLAGKTTPDLQRTPAQSHDAMLAWLEEKFPTKPKVVTPDENAVISAPSSPSRSPTRITLGATVAAPDPAQLTSPGKRHAEDTGASLSKASRVLAFDDAPAQKRPADEPTYPSKKPCVAVS